MKNNLNWFQHKTSDYSDPKIKMLRLLYAKRFSTDGWVADGKYYAVCCLVADSHLCMLDCTDYLKILTHASAIDLTPKDFEEFILMLEQCGLAKKEAGYVIVDEIQDSLSSIQIKRQATAERTRKWRENLDVTRHKFVTTKGDASQGDIMASHDKNDGVTSLESRVYKSILDTNSTTIPTGSNISDINESLPDVETSGLGNDTDKSGTPAAQGEKNGPPRAPRKSKPKPEDVTPHWKEMKEQFNQFILQNYKTKYSWNAAEATNMMKILKDLQKRAEDGGKQWNIGNARLRWANFLSAAYCDTFLHENFSLPQLYHHRNKIFLNAGSNGKQSHQQSPPVNGHVSTGKQPSKAEQRIQELASLPERVQALLDQQQENQRGNDY